MLFGEHCSQHLRHEKYKPRQANFHRGRTLDTFFSWAAERLLRARWFVVTAFSPHQTSTTYPYLNCLTSLSMHTTCALLSRGEHSQRILKTTGRSLWAFGRGYFFLNDNKANARTRKGLSIISFSLRFSYSSFFMFTRWLLVNQGKWIFLRSHAF